MVLPFLGKDELVNCGTINKSREADLKMLRVGAPTQVSNPEPTHKQIV